MKKILAVLLTAAMLCTLMSCLNGNVLPGQSGNGGTSGPSDPVIPSDTGDFDLELMSFVSENVVGNYMISPLSFRFALGLLLGGVNGETKTELLSALGVKSEEEWEKYCSDFNSFAVKFDESLRRDTEEYSFGILNGYVSKDEPEPYRALRVANSVWRNEGSGVEFKKDYIDRITSKYSAEQLSFDAGSVKELVNGWVNDKTEGMIPVLLDDGYDVSHLAVILMNALYFKDAWAKPFPKALTEKGTFYLADGTTSEKEFMTVEEDLLFYEDEDGQIAVLPMRGGESMIFVLGSAEKLEEKLAEAKTETVRVTVPKFELETSLSNGELVGFLKSRGAEKIFCGGDFSVMTDTPTEVGDIIQKTKIKLDEEGVEAAAVTAIMVTATAMPIREEPKIFRADRPFAFFITDGVSGMHTLFAGEIRN